MTEPVAIRYDFDGYGYKYMDSGSGSDWQTRVNGELLYTYSAKTQELLVEIAALKMMLANRNEIIDKLDLKSTPCKYTEGM
jgi:hypothetical protein